MVETAIAAGLIVFLVMSVRPRKRGRRRRNRHSFVYRHYIDNNSRLWRTRKNVWYYTHRHRCAKCGCHLSRHRTRWSEGANFNHLNYNHLLFERWGRDIEMICRPCHARHHGIGRR
jgi:hypothetical protein